MLNERYERLVEGRERVEICNRLKSELGLEGGVFSLGEDLQKIENERV